MVLAARAHNKRAAHASTSADAPPVDVSTSTTAVPDTSSVAARVVPTIAPPAAASIDLTHIRRSSSSLAAPATSLLDQLKNIHHSSGQAGRAVPSSSSARGSAGPASELLLFRMLSTGRSHVLSVAAVARLPSHVIAPQFLATCRGAQRCSSKSAPLPTTAVAVAVAGKTTRAPLVYRVVLPSSARGSGFELLHTLVRASCFIGLSFRLAHFCLFPPHAPACLQRPGASGGEHASRPVDARGSCARACLPQAARCSHSRVFSRPAPCRLDVGGVSSGRHCSFAPRRAQCEAGGCHDSGCCTGTANRAKCVSSRCHRSHEGCQAAQAAPNKQQRGPRA